MLVQLKFDSSLQMLMELDDFTERDTVLNEETLEHEEVGDKYFKGPRKDLTHGVVPRQWELWVRGKLSRPTGELLEDDTPVMETLKGYHVDIKFKTGSCPYLEEWTEKGYVVVPENPMFSLA